MIAYLSGAKTNNISELLVIFWAIFLLSKVRLKQLKEDTNNSLKTLIYQNFIEQKAHRINRFI